MTPQLSIVPISHNLVAHKSVLSYAVFSAGGAVDEICLGAETDTTAFAGGIFAILYASALFVQLLWVANDYRRRGIGTALLKEAERIATGRGCAQAVVETFSFHAPEFYFTQGYAEIGRVTGLGMNASDYRLSLQKRLH